MNILIKSSKVRVKHKMGRNIGYCWWNVNGTPRQITKGEKVFFGDSSGIHAEGKVISVEKGKIYMNALKKVEKKLPCKLPMRGFKYV